MNNERCTTAIQEETRSESINSIVTEILNLTINCKGISADIEGTIFGSEPCEPTNNNDMFCMKDALIQIRNNLKDTNTTLGNIFNNM